MIEPLLDWKGHICVPKNHGDDYSFLLGVEHWRDFFEVVEVDMHTWNELGRMGLWQEINNACGVLIDLYDEEWVWHSQES